MSLHLSDAGLDELDAGPIAPGEMTSEPYRDVQIGRWPGGGLYSLLVACPCGAEVYGLLELGISRADYRELVVRLRDRLAGEEHAERCGVWP